MLQNMLVGPAEDRSRPTSQTSSKRSDFRCPGSALDLYQRFDGAGQDGIGHRQQQDVLVGPEA